MLAVHVPLCSQGFREHLSENIVVNVTSINMKTISVVYKLGETDPVYVLKVEDQLVILVKK